MSAPSPSQTVLVVDDEVQIRRLLRITLEAAGYSVAEAETGRLGLEEAARRQPDAIVLDLGLPDLGGLEVLRLLREWSRAPVLVLTVLAGEADKVAALDGGADDYLTKPFGAAELTARLRAILRRAPGENEPSVVGFGDIEIDLAARVVRRAGAEVRLTAKEYAMLRLLVQHRGKVVTHGQMLRELWGPKAEGYTHYLRVHMTHIRQKLEAEPHRPRHLKTESGIGYRLVAD
ncbi:MAG: response regulator [Opitutaceae bacterium]|jgi:two-component system KDP operon response regulator KdpE